MYCVSSHCYIHEITARVKVLSSRVLYTWVKRGRESAAFTVRLLRFKNSLHKVCCVTVLISLLCHSVFFGVRNSVKKCIYAEELMASQLMKLLSAQDLSETLWARWLSLCMDWNAEQLFEGTSG